MSETGKRGLRGGRRRLLALAITLAVTVCCVGVFAAGGAAALGEQCSGANVTGKGSYLQSNIQGGVWASGSEEGFNGDTHPQACSGKQGSGGTPEVTYIGTGSGQGLNAWGAFDGVFHDKAARFIGTTEPPAGHAKEEGTQLNRMTSAIGSDVAVIPVTQTAIAIVANPPSLPAHEPCSVSEISASEIGGVFSGRVTNWRQLEAASNRKAGGDCDQAITRIVREEDSGTTYQFKHYLDQVKSEALECTGKSPRTWDQLQPSTGGEASPNRDWPRQADCQKGEGPVTTVATVGEGPSSPPKFVSGNPGTITYAGLPEARNVAPESILEVDNGVEAANPSTKENDANCAAAKYTLPEGAESGVNVDWSQVYGSDPEIGKVEASAYPICTLTWVVAATDSAGIFGNKAATTVRNYLEYVNATEIGKEGRHGHWYLGLPGPVAEIASIAIAQVEGEGKEEEEGGKGPAVLCSAEPEKAGGTLVCPEGKGYSGQIRGLMKPETVATFESTGGPKGTISCTAVTFIGFFKEDGTSVEKGVSHFEFGNAEGNCSSTLEFSKEAAVGIGNPPLDASKFVFLSAIAPQGALVLAKKEGEEPELHIGLGAEVKCHYSPTFLSGQVVNGPPTELIVGAAWTLAIGSEACPKSLKQATELHLDRGEKGADLFVSAK